MSDQIVHEAEVTRQHARYKIPAQIEIDGIKYELNDWSMSGCSIKDLPDSIKEDTYGVGKLIYAFDSFITVIDDIKLQFVFLKDGMMGTKYSELTPRQISIMTEIINAYLSGDIITTEGLINTVKRQNFVTKKKKHDEEEMSKSQKFLFRVKQIALFVFLVLFVGGLLSLLFYTIYQRVYVIESVSAYVDTNVTVIRAPNNSYINFTHPIEPGDEVRRGEILASADFVSGGANRIWSPVNGKIFSVEVVNSQFSYIAEPLFTIIDKEPKMHIIALLNYIDIKRMELGDDVELQLTDGTISYGYITSIMRPETTEADHAKPLNNIYSFARNYTKVFITPYSEFDQTLIGASISVKIDTLFKHDYSDEDRGAKVSLKEVIKD